MTGCYLLRGALTSGPEGVMDSVERLAAGQAVHLDVRNTHQRETRHQQGGEQ